VLAARSTLPAEPQEFSVILAGTVAATAQQQRPIQRPFEPMGALLDITGLRVTEPCYLAWLPNEKGTG